MIFKSGDTFENLFTVTEETYRGFIQTFGDENPLHTDELFAKAKGFKGKVMHGNILNGFLSYFIGECLPAKNVIILGQDIQFKHAVYLNDKLQFSATVIDIFESVNTVEFKFTFKNGEQQTVAKGKIQISLLL